MAYGNLSSCLMRIAVEVLGGPGTVANRADIILQKLENFHEKPHPNEHAWRKYIPTDMAVLWDALSRETQLALWIVAEQAARREACD